MAKPKPLKCYGCYHSFTIPILNVYSKTFQQATLFLCHSNQKVKQAVSAEFLVLKKNKPQTSSIPSLKLQPQRNSGGGKSNWLLHSLLQNDKDKQKSQDANGHSAAY